MAIGIVLCAIAGIFVLFGVFIYNKKVCQELMAFVMTVQMIGLMRMRGFGYPYIDLSWTLYGFSVFEFDWIPNALKLAFPVGYTETMYANVSLTYDNQSLFTTWGSILEVFVGLELALLLYYVIAKYRNPQNKKQIKERAKYFQHYILALVMIKTVFSCVLCWSSMNIMSKIDEMPKIFWIAQFVAIVLVITYVIYLILHLRKPQDKASTTTDLNHTHRK
jgi:hypothetical protein